MARKATSKQSKENEPSKLTLERTQNWKHIVFPVEPVPLKSLLNQELSIFDSGRSTAIVGQWPDGEKGIFAVQSAKYSLIPNRLFQTAADRVLGDDYQVLVRFSRKGDFQINLVLPERVEWHSTARIESDFAPRDILQRQITILNSYTGKSQIHLQATELKQVLTQRVRISYYRQICTNGLMAWADEFLTMDEYFDYLATGKKPTERHFAFDRSLEGFTHDKTSIETYTTESTQQLLQKSFSHRGLEEKPFLEFLCQFLTETIAYGQQSNSLTLPVYQKMTQKRVDDTAKALDLLIDASLPKKLAMAALERMNEEAVALQVQPNAWLLYNGANHALFNQPSSVPLDVRYKLDARLFHTVNTAYLLN